RHRHVAFAADAADVEAGGRGAPGVFFSLVGKYRPPIVKLSPPPALFILAPFWALPPAIGGGRARPPAIPGPAALCGTHWCPAAVLALDHAAPFRAVVAEFAIPFVVKEDFIALLQFLLARLGVHQFVEQVGVGRQRLFDLLRPLIEQLRSALLLRGLLLLVVVAALVVLLILFALLLFLIGFRLLLLTALIEEFVDAEGGDQRVGDAGVVAPQIIADYAFKLEDDLGVSAPGRFVNYAAAEGDLKEHLIDRLLDGQVGDPRAA